MIRDSCPQGHLSDLASGQLKGTNSVVCKTHVDVLGYMHSCLKQIPEPSYSRFSPESGNFFPLLWKLGPASCAGLVSSEQLVVLLDTSLYGLGERPPTEPAWLASHSRSVRPS